MVDQQKLRVGRLNTIGNVRHELGRVYRAARREEMDSLDASRLAAILKVVIECIRAHDFEDRLGALEEKVNEHR